MRNAPVRCADQFVEKGDAIDQELPRTIQDVHINRSKLPHHPSELRRLDRGRGTSVQSEELRDLGVDRLGRGGGCPAVDDIAFLVDEELLEVPLEGGMGQ